MRSYIAICIVPAAALVWNGYGTEVIVAIIVVSVAAVISHTTYGRLR